MNRLIKLFKKEQGDVLILFAFSLVILVGMTALATDVGLLAIKRAELMEIGQVMRDARLDQTEQIWNANNPADTFDDIVREYGMLNGLDSSQISTTYKVVNRTSTKREHEVSIILSDTYQCTTLRLFGLKDIPIDVVINGSAFKENSGGVWSPPS